MTMTMTTTHTQQHRRWRFAIAAALSTTVAGLASITPSSVSASTENVVIYFAVCDGSGGSDTVKIKKINEDGTGLAVIGDTTIAMCGDAPETYFSGLAVTKEFSYFSWYRMNGSGAGVGRISNDGSSPLNINYMTLPTSPLISWFQMSPKVLNGHLYLNVSNLGSPQAHRIMRGSLTTGTLETCHQPEDLGDSGSLSIGVGRDSVYFAAFKTGDALSATKIYKTDCTSTTVASDFGIAAGAAMFHRPFVGPIDWDADGNQINNPSVQTSTLIAESDSTSYIYTIKSTTSQKDTAGISTVSNINLTDFANHGAVVGGSDFTDFTDSQVWGFNYLYYKDGAARKMYRVKPGSAPERAFASQIPGDHILHHMSVVKETVTPASTPPTTKAPLLINKKGVTGKQIASDIGVTIPRGSKIKLAVAKNSRKVCAVKKSRVVAIQKGKNCRVTITITPKKGKVIKRTTSFTTS